jgi:hypothetical protein
MHVRLLDAADALRVRAVLLVDLFLLADPGAEVVLRLPAWATDPMKLTF